MHPLYSNLKKLDQIQSETDQFLEDLTFFESDIIFLRLAVDRYFRRISQIENLEQLRRCLGRFQEMGVCHKNLLQQLKLHLSRIATVSKQESTVLECALLMAHLNFCSQMKQFISQYRFLRNEILSIADAHPDKDHELNSSYISGHLFSPN